MIRQYFTSLPNKYVYIVPVPDTKYPENKVKALEAAVKVLFSEPFHGVLHTSEAFGKLYEANGGKWELGRNQFPSTVLLEEEIARLDCTSTTMADASFRRGMIAAMRSQFPISWPTVDMAIRREINDPLGAGKQVLYLFGKKPGEKNWRFAGGFKDRKDKSFEESTYREGGEEVLVEGVDPQKVFEPPYYISSRNVNDWRYADEPDGITTHFYGMNFIGTDDQIKANDDLADAKWFAIDEKYGKEITITPDMVEGEHKFLLEDLCEYERKQASWKRCSKCNTVLTCDCGFPTHPYATKEKRSTEHAILEIDMDTDTLIPKIHETRTKAVLIITGGGTEVLPVLLKRGGGSATLLSAVVPYANAETVELLGGEPEKFVSEQTARQLAMAAYQRALELRSKDEPVCGVACTSALQKTPEEREGRIHHIFCALQTGYKTISLSLTLDAGHFTWEWQGQPIKPTAYDVREWEETINAKMLLALVAEGCGLRAEVVHPKIVRRESTLLDTWLPQLLSGEATSLVYMPEFHDMIAMPVGNNIPEYLLPGSFNPMHPGHVEMAEHVENFSGNKVAFEISIRNADKPMLDFITLQERLESCGKKRHVWLTNAPTFAKKALIFPGTTFLVGWDTAKRIVDPKYGNVDKAITTFEKTGVRFIIFGREINGEYHCELDGFPKRFCDLSSEVIERLHNRAVSSTGIRSEEK